MSFGRLYSDIISTNKDLVGLGKLLLKKSDSYSDSKVFNQTTNSFDRLVTLDEIQNKLGNDITDLKNQVSVTACNGDWDTNQTLINTVAIQPYSNNIAVIYNKCPNGRIRVNFTISRID